MFYPVFVNQRKFEGSTFSKLLWWLLRFWRKQNFTYVETCYSTWR